MSDCSFKWVTDSEIRAANRDGGFNGPSALCRCGRWEYFGKHHVQARRMWREDHVISGAGIGGTT